MGEQSVQDSFDAQELVTWGNRVTVLGTVTNQGTFASGATTVDSVGTADGTIYNATWETRSEECKGLKYRWAI